MIKAFRIGGRVVLEVKSTIGVVFRSWPRCRRERRVRAECRRMRGFHSYHHNKDGETNLATARGQDAMVRMGLHTGTHYQSGPPSPAAEPETSSADGQA
jgi:hypothetical protein